MPSLFMTVRLKPSVLAAVGKHAPVGATRANSGGAQRAQDNRRARSAYGYSGAVRHRQPGKSGSSEISRQIPEKSTRLELGECGAAEAEIPEIDVGQVLDLHTQRRWSSQDPEPVSTAQGNHRRR